MDQVDRAKTLLCEALDADSLGSKELALQTYLDASLALLIEPRILLDQLIFEDDFEVKHELVDESKKCLELLERCVTRAGELFQMIESKDETSITLLRRSSSSASQVSTTPTSSPLRKMRKKSSRGANVDLSQVRKQFEKASLAEIIARQKRQSEMPTMPPKQQQPQQQGMFSINLQIISDLLSQRQDAIGNLNEKLFSLFDSKSKDLNSREDNDIWRKTLKISISSTSGDFMQPIGPIIGLLSHPSHPISQISRDFVIRLKKLTSLNDENTAKQISKEYHQFSFQMIKLLRHNYAEELSDDSLELPLQISIETFMFSHLPCLGTGIHESFLKANSEEDSFFLHHLCTLSWANFDQEDDALYKLLNVPEKYRLSPSKYDPAVNELRLAASLKCPTLKAMAAVKVCDLICSAIEKVVEEEAIGSEDLVLLLSWVIVQAQVPSMISFFDIVSEFLPDELIRGQAGYVLATLQTCLDYIKSIKINK